MSSSHSPLYHEVALPYALGLLEAQEAQVFEAHLAEGCEACAREVDEWRRLHAQLAFAVQPVAPSPELEARLVQRIAGSPRDSAAASPAEVSARDRSSEIQVWKDWPIRTAGDVSSAGEDNVLRADSRPYEEIGIPGIRVRRLGHQDDGRKVTMMIEMEPGARYPAHRHAEEETCFVLRGDLLIGDLHMRAGDYQQVARGSVHPEQTTRNGCLLLIQSSVGDELLPDA